MTTHDDPPPAFQLPAALLSQGYTLRPETEDDTPFLFRLYASTREQELAQAIGWSAEQKLAFITQQFQAQRQHYRNFIPNCSYQVIEHDAVPVGRLYLEERVTQVHITDIVLLPEMRGNGAGTAMLKALIGFAHARGKGLGIFVEKFNPALRLYRRLGFVEIGDSDVYLEMDCPVEATETPVS